MKGNIILKLFFSLLIIVSGTVQAQRGNHPQPHKAEKRAAVHQHHYIRAIKRYNKSRIVVVKKRRGRTISVLPNGARRVHYNQVDYHFHSGRFYRAQTKRYTVVLPPRGLRITMLPANSQRLVWNKQAYFYNAGTYYTQQEEEYVVAAAEEGMVVTELPDDLIEEVKINEQTYYELDNILYQKIEAGYKVIGESEA